MSTLNALPESSIPIFTTVESIREWRRRVFLQQNSVGLVPTMGALHEGHISLVRRSISENDHTVVSIFVNPAQFAPHEDLATYPRTLESDLKFLSSTISPNSTSLAIFLPSVSEMYPSGISQDVGEQKGTFIEVKGYGQQMEGRSRPTFFRGVATVVTKLFNAVEPTHAYFGQKDIQQGLLLRRMVRDTLCSHPTPYNLHIIPTHRSPVDGLALSSRNAYLTPSERQIAGVLYKALRRGEELWKGGLGRVGAVEGAKSLIMEEKEGTGIELRLDYIEMNDPESLQVVDWETKEGDGRPVVLSGALWIGRTRLIDNIILGDSSKLLT